MAKSKAEWAEGKARECDEQAYEIQTNKVHYSKVGGKYRAASTVRAEAARYRRMARNYRENGQ